MGQNGVEINTALFNDLGQANDLRAGANNDQQLPCPGDGRVENAAAEKVRRAVPGAQNHSPVL